MFGKLKKRFTNVKEFSDYTGNPVRDIFAGNILKRKNLIKQWKLLLLVCVLTFCYIGNRYSCEKKIAEIDQLQRKLQDVKYDALSRSFELMSLGKQSEIENAINNNGINLTESTKSPYRITLE